MEHREHMSDILFRETVQRRELLHEITTSHEFAVTLISETGTTYVIQSYDVQEKRESYDDEPRDEVVIYCNTCQQEFHWDHYEQAPFWARRLYDIAYRRQYEAESSPWKGLDAVEEEMLAARMPMAKRGLLVACKEEKLSSLEDVCRRVTGSLWRLRLVSQNLFLIETTRVEHVIDLLEQAGFNYTGVYAPRWSSIGHLVRWKIV